MGFQTASGVKGGSHGEGDGLLRSIPSVAEGIKSCVLTTGEAEHRSVTVSDRPQLLYCGFMDRKIDKLPLNIPSHRNGAPTGQPINASGVNDV
jgi:hypothetical protein